MKGLKELAQCQCRPVVLAIAAVMHGASKDFMSRAQYERHWLDWEMGCVGMDVSLTRKSVEARNSKCED